MNKELKTILFDLDGTLLPMDQDLFLETYFGLLIKNLSSHGFDPQKLLETVYSGTGAMLKNDGKNTNETVFWNHMAKIYGEDVRSTVPLFEQFYKDDFPMVQKSCGYNKDANVVIKELKKRGYQLILATNPLFPSIATEQRIKWAGLDINDFDFVTTYENSKYCKPNMNYYLEIIEKMDLNPKYCMMVGNDVSEDMIVQNIGMTVFLITRDLINKNNEDINKYPNGTLIDLLNYVN